MVKIDVDFMGTKPMQAHEGDAGSDLHSAHDGLVTFGKVSRFQTGTKIRIPDGHVGLVFSRSGYSTVGITLANSVGVIDSSYIGELMVNLTKSTPGDYMVAEGERIAQLVIVPIVIPNLQRVAAFDMTERGENGFGSSGK